MKPIIACVAALFLFAALERPAHAGPSVSVAFFYESLAPHGDWVDVEGYGYCFRPAISTNNPEWRPYMQGSWIYTEAGWTWDSEEDFGWATYHYGRWFLLGGAWFWVPGDTWGPAWVSWRTGEEVVGWAPLPPEASWRPEVGFSVYVDVDYNIGPACYNFIPVRCLGEPRLGHYVAPWQKNLDFMKRTTNCTRISQRSGDSPITAVFNDGPDFIQYSRITDRPVRRMKLVEHEAFNAREGNTRLRNESTEDRFRVIAPHIENRDREPAPAVVRQKVARAQMNHGWNGFPQEEVRDFRERAELDRHRERKTNRDKGDQIPREGVNDGNRPPIAPSLPPPAMNQDTSGPNRGSGTPDSERRPLSPEERMRANSPENPRHRDQSPPPGPRPITPFEESNRVQPIPDEGRPKEHGRDHAEPPPTAPRIAPPGRGRSDGQREGNETRQPNEPDASQPKARGMAPKHIESDEDKKGKHGH